MSEPPPEPGVFRRRIIELVADDMRGGNRQMLGLSAGNVISLIRIPVLSTPLYPGGTFDFKGIIVDRDTPYSPEVLLVQTARQVGDGTAPEEYADGAPIIPGLIQDPWHRAPEDNLWVLVKLMALPTNQLGSLASAVMRATARSLLWSSGARTECFSMVGGEAMLPLSRIANAKGHAPAAWLAAQAAKVIQAIEIDPQQANGPKSTVAAEIANQVLVQQAAGVRPPASHTAGGRPPGAGQATGTGGAPGAQSRAKQRSAPPDNRVADGDFHALIDALRAEDPEGYQPPGGEEPPDFEPEHGLEDGDFEGIEEFLTGVNPEEAAAFADMSIPEKPKRIATAGQPKGIKKSSSMAAISFGGGGKKPPRPSPRPR